MECACGSAIGKPQRGPTPSACATCRAEARRAAARDRYAARRPEPEAPLRVVALGAGQQSTAMLLMAMAGVLPRADVAVFCDTGAERVRTYEHLARLREHCAAHDFPLHVLTPGNLWDHVQAEAGGRLPIPVIARDGERTVRFHQHCTATYKVQAIRAHIRELLGMGPQGAPRAGRSAELWLGISLDETGRMRDNDVAYIEHRYPLVDARLDRTACVEWLTEHWPHPVGRSSCVFCPYQSQAEWQQLREEDPAGFRAVCALDAEIREHDRFDGGVFLHRSCKPLREAVALDAQLTLDAEWGSDCAGVCGV